MRKLMSFTFALLIGTGLFAGTEPTTVSAELLTKAVWTTDNASTESTIYYDFQESSIVDIITQKKDGSLVWNTSFWSITEKNGVSYLTIEPKKGSAALQFQVSASGEGVLLSNEDLSAMLSTVNPVAFDVVKSDVLGSWKSPFYDLKTGAEVTTDTKIRNMWKLGFQFNEDGTFVRYTQKGKTAEHEVGVWNLSNDGQFIKLHFAKDGNIENIHKKEILNIKDFKRDFMVVKPEANHKKDRSEIEIVNLNKKSA
jgi:hypothetical protein